MRGSVIKDDDLNRIFLAYMRYPIDLLYKECKNLYDDITDSLRDFIGSIIDCIYDIIFPEED